MTVAAAVVDGQTCSAKGLRIAMIGLRGIPASYGGVERAVEELAANLADRGHSVTVYARAAYSPRGLRTHRGVEIKRLPQINTKHLEAASHTILAMVHALSSQRFDLIHLHATGPGAMSALSRAAGVPVVVTIQGLDWRREKWGRGARLILRTASEVAVKAPDRAIVVSRELQRYYRDEFRVETTYIPNGVTPEDEMGSPPLPGLEKDRFLLYLGRLVPEKGLHTLIRAYRRVPGNMSLVIAGPDSHSPEYVGQLHSLADSDPRVKLIGPQYGPEKAWLLHNALVFIQPSSIEGLPIALLEALSAGRFPLVSSIPENLEPVTIDDRPCGVSFPVGDEAALAAAIAEAQYLAPRSDVGRQLSDHVAKVYDWRAIAQLTEDVYREILVAAAANKRSANDRAVAARHRLYRYCEPSTGPDRSRNERQ